MSFLLFLLSPGYHQFLLSLSPLIQEWQQLLCAHIAKQTVAPLAAPLPDRSGAIGLGLSRNAEDEKTNSPVDQVQQEQVFANQDSGGSACVVS